MKRLTRRDLISALMTGLTTGVVAWRILVFLDLTLPLGIPLILFVPVLPVLWVIGVKLGYVLGASWRPMTQFGRFVAVGFANTAVDFGVLYLFIGLTGNTAAGAYAVFKALSFTMASIHSYFWNKYWAFEAGATRGGTREVLRFVAVALLAVGVNTAVATSVVLLRPEMFTPEVWAGVSAAVGSATALVFSFIGFRVFVFKKKRV